MTLFCTKNGDESIRTISNLLYVYLCVCVFQGNTFQILVVNSVDGVTYVLYLYEEINVVISTNMGNAALFVSTNYLSYAAKRGPLH